MCSILLNLLLNTLYLFYRETIKGCFTLISLPAATVGYDVVNIWCKSFTFGFIHVCYSSCGISTSGCNRLIRSLRDNLDWITLERYSGIRLFILYLIELVP